MVIDPFVRLTSAHICQMPRLASTNDSVLARTEPMPAKMIPKTIESAKPVKPQVGSSITHDSLVYSSTQLPLILPLSQ